LYVFILTPRGLIEADPSLKWGTSVKYLVSDLEDVDKQLKELEEEDEIAISLMQNARSRSSSTRSRRSNSNVTLVESDHVEKFVEEKHDWVKSEQQVRFSSR
jgi:hypothetical protein